MILSYGGIAQLGERLNGIQEVRGSTPLISTKSLEILGFQGFFRTFCDCSAALEFSEISIIQEVQKWQELR